MTIADHATLELGDLVRVRFDCKSCGAALSLSVAKWSSIPFECPGCHTDWIYQQTPAHQTLEQLAGALRAALAILERPAPYRLSFEVSRLPAGDDARGLNKI